jgi:hypothetical protein
MKRFRARSDAGSGSGSTKPKTQKSKPPNLDNPMTKILIVLMLTGLATTSGVLASEKAARKKSAPAKTEAPQGTTTEVRYTSAPSHQKGPRLSKVVITRDSAGRIISVKRH